MIQARDHRNPDDLRLMLEIVRRFGPAAEEAVRILAKAAKDEDEDEAVRRAAQEALKSIPRSALEEWDP